MTSAILPHCLTTADLPGLTLCYRGKVRDIFTLPGAPSDDSLLLIVATDRLSAFDVVLPDPIPGKGEILCQISNFWFAKTEHFIANHLTGISVASVLPDPAQITRYEKRAVVAKKLNPVPIEAIARGYLIGSGWRDYQRTGHISGIALPSGMQKAQQLAQPIFTPSTKSSTGNHDENIDFDTVVRAIGVDLAEKIRSITLQIYRFAYNYAAQRGIILADTKFEFGTDADNNLYVIDEMLTPDSSRYWPKDQYNININPPSYDKQFVRDYLDTLDWDKTAPGPHLPVQILARTQQKYIDILQKLTD